MIPPLVSAGLCGLAALAIAPWWLRAIRRDCSRWTGRRATTMVLTGLFVLSLLVGWRFADDPTVVAWWWSGLCGVGLAVIDTGEHWLPRAWMGALGIGVLLVFAVLTVVYSDSSALWRAITAAAVVWLGMRLIEAVCAGAMGGGDTRLQAVLALSLGWISWPAVLLGVIAGTLLLGVAAGFGWLVGKRDWTSRIPAGPSLLLGFWCVLFMFAP